MATATGQIYLTNHATHLNVAVIRPRHADGSERVVHVHSSPNLEKKSRAEQYRENDWSFGTLKSYENKYGEASFLSTSGRGAKPPT